MSKIFYSVEFNKHSGGKWRKFNNPNPDLCDLINEVSIELKSLFPDMQSPNRVRQSMEDIRCMNEYDYVKFLDVIKALMNGNVRLICLVLLFLNPRMLSVIPKILKIYSSPVLNDDGQFLNNRKYKLKAGFKTSEQILNILFLIPIRIFNTRGSARLYVDDLILFSNHKLWLQFSYFFLKIYFFILGFRFHKVQSFDLRKRPSKCGERLGIQFGFTKNEALVTRIRPRTLKKYRSRIRRSVHNVDAKTALARVAMILHGSKDCDSYPIYSTFNNKIWTDAFQRKQFFARCCGDLRSQFTELRKYSKEELSELLLMQGL